MKRRSIAAGLCVALAHVVLIGLLLDSRLTLRAPDEGFVSEPITVIPPTLEDDRPPPVAAQTPAFTPRDLQAPELPEELPAESPTPAPEAPPGRTDWPVEARKSAKRVLAAEAEAERIARLFSGPQGTWASLTKRQRSEVKKFRWKDGVDGMEYDDKGNSILHISSRCVIVNLSFIGCSLGKDQIHGDLFKDMRKYFDEQRLPQNDDGNGTEPEALRPAN